MRYTLGLDLGIASAGWAVINLDVNRVEALGVRAFSAAEDPKTRAPLAEPRRLARSTRLRLRRRVQRLHDIKKLFIAHRLIDSSLVDSVFIANAGKPSPWVLRALGLDQLLSGDQLARALYHIAKRRGYAANSKADSVGDEDGAVLKALNDNERRMNIKGHRTVGEMFERDPEFQLRKRNRPSDYSRCVQRGSLQQEIKCLFDAQRRFGSKFATTDLESEFLNTFSRQLPFATAEDVLSKFGVCTFEKMEKRAPKNSFSAEYFTLLHKVNCLAWYDSGIKTQPGANARTLLIQAALQKCKLTYRDVRRTLSLGDALRFVGVDYRTKDTNDELKAETKQFCSLEGYKELRRISEAAGEWQYLKENRTVSTILRWS